VARRKLSHQQKRRIARQQRRDLGKVDVQGEGEKLPGDVIAHFGKRVTVQHDGRMLSCHLRANLPPVVVGDRVAWQHVADSDDGVVIAIEDRDTALCRPDPYGHLKPVAANVDIMAVVFAPLPAPSSVLLDRYLVAAELSGIEPVLLLNKADLVDEAMRPAMDDLCRLYRDLDYRVLEVSAVSGDGMDTLRRSLAGHTSVLVGQSGVGKSSLVNALIPEVALDTAEISANSGLGQHTTTTAQLFHLPDGGRLIDSPGIREFGLWHISEAELLSGYRELAPLAAQCRFRNCSHRREPGCALRQAAEDGLVDAERLDNFFHIAESLDAESREKYHR
jgi:ribosome biogenesis GTPase